jgi:hypothetical protein
MNKHYLKYKDSIKLTSAKYLHEHQEMRMYNTSKHRAKKHNIEFTIKLEDIIITKFCPLLGIPITNIFGKGRQQTNASLDRLDSAKGYTKENIQVISDLANRMKQDATPEQLITFAKNILQIYS